MDRPKENKLNLLLQKWPPGTIAPTSWLKENGISRQLLDRYEQYHWVTRVAKGAVKKKGDTLTWQGMFYSLQKMQGVDLWLGGKSALEQKGLGHFVGMSLVPTLHVYSASISKLPHWVFALEELAHLQFHHRKLFSSNIEGFIDFDFERLKIKISSPERAAFEMLDGILAYQTFEEAKLIFENLTTLRANLVQSLLENCQSIKVKRLFLYLADTCQHQWFSKLKLKKVDLGSGKRSIVNSGQLNLKYQIVIPRESEK